MPERRARSSAATYAAISASRSPWWSRRPRLSRRKPPNSSRSPMRSFPQYRGSRMRFAPGGAGRVGGVSRQRHADLATRKRRRRASGDPVRRPCEPSCHQDQPRRGRAAGAAHRHGFGGGWTAGVADQLPEPAYPAECPGGERLQGSSLRNPRDRRRRRRLLRHEDRPLPGRRSGAVGSPPPRTPGALEKHAQRGVPVGRPRPRHPPQDRARAG